MTCVWEGSPSYSGDCGMYRREAGTALGSVLLSDRRTEEEETTTLTVTY
jgi:hypothetical protein